MWHCIGIIHWFGWQLLFHRKIVNWPVMRVLSNVLEKAKEQSFLIKFIISFTKESTYKSIEDKSVLLKKSQYAHFETQKGM